MNDIDTSYDPAYGLDLEKDFPLDPLDARLRTSSGGTPDSVTGISDFDQHITDLWTCQRDMLAMDNFTEWQCLHKAPSVERKLAI
jgi:hypothetical protein